MQRDASSRGGTRRKSLGSRPMRTRLSIQRREDVRGKLPQSAFAAFASDNNRRANTSAAVDEWKALQSLGERIDFENVESL